METPPIRKITIDRHSRGTTPKTGKLKSAVSAIAKKLPGKNRHKKKRPTFKKTASYVLVVGAAISLAVLLGGVAFIAWVAGDLPDPNNIINRKVDETTKIYDRTGEHVLYQVHGEEKRTVVELDQVSPHVINATIAAEDKDFYEHKGFSLTGYVRAFLSNLRSGERSQGGSTLTQQFVKNAVLSPEKTYTRKLKELVLSFELERRFTKDEILKLYLNEIPYGPVIYGVQSAAESFFGKDAKDLTVSESAMITAVSNATTYFSPYGNHTDALMDRTHWIIDRMLDEGYISVEEAEEAKRDDLLGRLEPQNATIKAPHFVFYVRELLVEEFGEQLVDRGGLKVITTLDVEKQDMAEAAVADNIESIQENGGSTTALMSFDPKTGDIIAMIGSVDYFDDEISGKFNALRGRLQPGSSIKPIAYANAFEQGFTPDTVVYDVKTDFNGYRPNNYDLGQRGPVTFAEALGASLNIPAVKALYLGGLDDFVRFAERLGYTTLSDRSQFGLSVVLGGATVNPIEHINAFGAFASDGVYRPARAVLKVETKEGESLFEIDEEEDPGKRVIERQIARQVNGILSNNALRVPTFGEYNVLRIGDRPVAAKTGTTNDYKDAWTIGYTPSLVTGVWVGNADGSEMERGAGGSRVAGPIWNAYMRSALEGTPYESFPAAEKVETGKPVLDGEKQAQVTLKIDTISGKLATEHTPPELVEERGFGEPHSILYFIDRHDPRGPAPEDPASDPMFSRWEAAVAAWVDAQEDIDLSTDPVPTEYDDIHVPENIPSISIERPSSGQSIGERTFFVEIDATSRRGVERVTFSINGDEFDSLRPPFRGMITVPNRFGKGFHTLTATAYDDVRNRASENVTINLIADPLPLDVRWSGPRDNDILYSSQFPYNLRFSIGDVESVEALRLVIIDDAGVSEVIGRIDDPALPNMSIRWNEDPGIGTFELKLIADLVGGESVSTSIDVHVR